MLCPRRDFYEKSAMLGVTMTFYHLHHHCTRVQHVAPKSAVYQSFSLNFYNELLWLLSLQSTLRGTKQKKQDIRVNIIKFIENKSPSFRQAPNVVNCTQLKRFGVGAFEEHPYRKFLINLIIVEKRLEGLLYHEKRDTKSALAPRRARPLTPKTPFLGLPKVVPPPAKMCKNGVFGRKRCIFGQFVHNLHKMTSFLRTQPPLQGCQSVGKTRQFIQY